MWGGLSSYRPALNTMSEFAERTYSIAPTGLSDRPAG